MSVVREVPDHRGAGRMRRVERSVLRMHGGILTAMAVLILLDPIGAPGSVAVGRIVVAAVPAIVLLAIAVDLQFRGERLIHLAGLVAVFGWFVATEASFGQWANASSGFCIGALGLSAARLLRMRWHFALMAAAALAWIFGSGVLAGHPSVAVDDFLLGWSMSFGAVMFVDALTGAARRAVAADAAASEQRAALQREDAERSAVATAEQALHDDVLNALRMIEGGNHSVAVVRRWCANAVASVGRIVSIEGARHPATEPDAYEVPWLVSQLRGATTLELTFDVSGGDALPQEAARALLRGAGEALRNAERHSGRSDARVRIETWPAGAVVEVIDRGVGMPPDAVAGYGTRGSIEEPIAQVGGTVEYAETAGGGVTVRLLIPTRVDASPGVLAETYDLTVRATGSSMPLLQVAVLVAAAFSYMAVRYSFTWERPAVSLTLAAVFIAMTVAVVHRLVSRASSWGWHVGVALALLGGLVVALRWMPDGALLDGRSWPNGFVAVPLMFLVLVVPVRYAVATLVPFPVVVAVACHLDPGLAGGPATVSMLQSPVMLPVIWIVVGVVLRRLGAVVRDEERAREQVAAERARRSAAELVATRHLDYTRRVVVPWLARVAADEIDPDDPAVRARARRYAGEVRDDLYAPGFFDDGLRAAAASFRERGGQLRLRPGLAPGAAGGAVGVVLERLIAGLDGDHSVTVIPAGGRRPQVRVALVPPVAVAERAVEGIDATVGHDDFRTVIMFGDAPASVVA